MWKNFKVSFWNQHPSINDCFGNRNEWKGKARSAEEAVERAKKYNRESCGSFFRLRSIEPLPDCEREKILTEEIIKLDKKIEEFATALQRFHMKKSHAQRELGGLILERQNQEKEFCF